MKRWQAALAAFGLVLAFAGSARAELHSSPRNFTLHVGFGPYNPSAIDDGVSGSPTSRVFGSTPKLMFQAGLEYMVWQGWGTLGLEGASGFWQASGKALRDDGSRSSDSSTFNIVPIKGSLVYRLTYFQETFNVPLAPFAKFGFDYWIWWNTNQRDAIVRHHPAGGGESKALGATYGLHVNYGLAFNLNFIDPTLARAFDQSTGVNGTYLYVEGIYSWLEDFGAGGSWDLSAHTLLAGILFEF